MPHNKIQKRIFRDILCEKLNFPAAVASIPTAEITGTEQVIVSFCYAINYYSESEIHLDMKNYKAVIKGDRLSMTAYTNGQVKIHGTIHSVSLIDPEKEFDKCK